MPGDRPSNSPWLRVVLAGATLFVLGGIAAGVVVLTGDDSDSGAPEAATVAEGGFPTVPVQTDGPEQDDQAAAPTDNKGGQGGGGSNRAGGSSGGDSAPDTTVPASEVKCPPGYEREQCEGLKEAWENAESHPLKTGKCPRDYGRDVCKALQQSWDAAESHPIESGEGKNPKDVDCPYGREQCKLLYQSWLEATQ